MSYDGTVTHADPMLVTTFLHEDGSKTYIVIDDDAEHANPRDNDGNVTTLIQKNDRRNDIDTDEAGLQEARDKWDYLDNRWFTRGEGTKHQDANDKRLIRLGLSREDMVKRYVAMFRDDIVHYADHFSFGRDGFGWGYITKEKFDEAFPSGEEYFATIDYTMDKLFDQEVDIYGQWAEGEVYGYHHVTAEGEENDSCWGFLGYDSYEDIAKQATDSPIVGEE
jgi:hypothetical protein